jgi:hypothetical protein
MKNLLSLGLACSLLLSPKSIGAGLMADSKKVSAVEYLYADVSDANTILATIDSGLLSTYQGKDRAAWEKFYRKKRAKLAKELERLPASGLSGGDTRAIAAMRKQLKAFCSSRPVYITASTGNTAANSRSALGSLYAASIKTEAAKFQLLQTTIFRIRKKLHNYKGLSNAKRNSVEKLSA